MKPQGPDLDLIVLVPDKNMQEGLRSLLTRARDLGIRHDLKYEVWAHPYRDPGVRLECQEFLRPFLRRASRALVLFDREGSGAECATRVQIEAQVQEKLDANGWRGRSAVVVIDPELELWFWGDWRACATVLEVASSGTTLWDLLRQEGQIPAQEGKPAQPKETLEKILRRLQRPRSSALYRSVAQAALLRSCKDPAFQKLCKCLRNWFPSATGVR